MAAWLFRKVETVRVHLQRAGHSPGQVQFKSGQVQFK